MASKRVANPKTGAVPRQPRAGSASTSRPGSAGASKTGAAAKPPTCPMAAAKLKKQKKEEAEPPPGPKVYENPAFSIPLKRVQTNPLLAEKEKKKTIRRNIPPGEDLKEIKKILVSLKKREDVTVGEFLALIGPSTGDNGEVFRTVLTEDMNSFRTLARNIYDTMTQDVSDVLTNQHIQLKEYEQEKTTLYTEKMMRAINEIYSYAPKFDFELYYADSEGYLASLFPVPKLIEADSDEAEMHRRQQAFHRLNWLRTEGDRLSAENARLQARLNELKREQKQEMMAAESREAEAEAKREELQAQEAAMQQQLEKLTDKVEETMIDTEASIRVATDEANILAPRKKVTAKTAAAQRRRKKQPEWASDAAADIEEKAIEETIIAEGAQSEAVEPESVAGAIKKVRQVSKKKSREAFHFSPIKTPPSKPPPPKERSPFHFSPIKSPPQIQVQAPPSPFHFTPPKPPERPVEEVERPASPPAQLHTTRLRTERVTVKERTPKGALFPPSSEEEGITPLGQGIPEADTTAPYRPGMMQQQRPQMEKMAELSQAATPEPTATPQPAVRRGRQYAPRDTWGGFY